MSPVTGLDQFCGATAYIVGMDSDLSATGNAMDVRP